MLQSFLLGRHALGYALYFCTVYTPTFPLLGVDLLEVSRVRAPRESGYSMCLAGFSSNKQNSSSNPPVRKSPRNEASSKHCWLFVACLASMHVQSPFCVVPAECAHCQAGSMVYRKHARAFMRTLRKLAEVWRTLANPQRHIHENHLGINQSSGEGFPDIHQSFGEGAFCVWVAFKICPTFSHSYSWRDSKVSRGSAAVCNPIPCVHTRPVRKELATALACKTLCACRSALASIAPLTSMWRSTIRSQRSNDYTRSLLSCKCRGWLGQLGTTAVH